MVSKLAFLRLVFTLQSIFSDTNKSPQMLHYTNGSLKACIHLPIISKMKFKLLPWNSMTSFLVICSAPSPATSPPYLIAITNSKLFSVLIHIIQCTLLCLPLEGIVQVDIRSFLYLPRHLLYGSGSPGRALWAGLPGHTNPQMTAYFIFIATQWVEQ